MNYSWSFANIWNKSLDEMQSDRIPEPRERIWASELGGSQIDRYLKMKAIPYTNPPNSRSRRKFEAGNIWESIVGYVLNRAGILVKKQEYLEYQYPGLLPVTGKLDFIAGGSPDYDKALSIVNNEMTWLPPFIVNVTKDIIESLKKKFPNGLKEIVLEIKSCSAFMFEIYESRQTASPQHKLQIYHYLKSTDMNEGHIVYVSRDDARILEIGISHPSVLEDIYKTDIKQMTNYVRSDITPKKEPLIVFSDDLGRFSANWKVAYSNYLTFLYGFENQKEFDDKHKPLSERFNRVLRRIKEGVTLTENNLEAIEEMKELGFNIDKIKESLKGELKK